MAKLRVGQHDRIIELLQLGVAPKVIASSLGVAYQTVINIKNYFFNTVLIPKSGKIPDPDQRSFFHNFWAEKDD